MSPLLIGWLSHPKTSPRKICQGQCTRSIQIYIYMRVCIYLNMHVYRIIYITIYIYISYVRACVYMVLDQNSFIPERPFFANKNFTFAKLSRTPCLSFAGPMLANNTSYEDSFTTCQITLENHGSLLGSLLNMQLASRSPFSGQFFLQSLLAHPLQHAL